jgi:hypothetical protein
MSDNIEEIISSRLQEIAACCTTAAAQVERGEYQYAIDTLDETIEFGGDTVEKMQNILIKLNGKEAA